MRGEESSFHRRHSHRYDRTNRSKGFPHCWDYSTTKGMSASSFCWTPLKVLFGELGALYIGAHLELK